MEHEPGWSATRLYATCLLIGLLTGSLAGALLDVALYVLSLTS